MLIFIIPVKNKLTAKSWDELSKYFDRTIRSICNQTSNEFKAIVVCNEKPVTDFFHPNLHYCYVDFPVPKPDYTAKMDDRSKRVVAGLIAAKQFSPSHVMFIDADDCISKNIAEFVQTNSHKNGWYVNTGFEYVEGANKITYRRNKFNRLCGSCNIIGYRLLSIPNHLYPYEQISGYDRFITGHSFAQVDLANKGFPIDSLPFPGAVYVRDTVGESVTLEEPFSSKIKRSPKETIHGLKNFVFSPINDRPLTSFFEEEFGLFKLNN